MESVKKAIEGLARQLGVEQKPPLFSATRLKIEGTSFEIGHHAALFFWFNTLVVVCIITDSVVVGVEIDQNIGDSIQDRMGYWLLDLLFGLVFITEMALRLRQHSWEYFRDGWNIFDYICVLLTVTTIVSTMNSTSDADNARLIKALKSFRVFRLLRVVRHLVGLKALEGFYVVVTGLLQSVQTLVWVGIFMFIVVYCFGVGLVTLVGGEEERLSRWRDANIYVGGVAKAMWTTFQVATFDDWAPDIARPLIQAAPTAGCVLLAAIVVLSFGIFNVILAVMVEHIRSTMDAKNFRAARRVKETENLLLERMGEDFNQCDKNHNGELSHEEFMKLIKRDDFTYKLRLVGLQSSEAEALFGILDADQSGSITVEEFVRGLHKIKGAASGKDLLPVICFAQRECRRARQYVERVRRLSDRADDLQGRLNTMGAAMTAEITQRTEVDLHHQQIREHAGERDRIFRRFEYDERTTFPSLGN